MPDLWDGKAAGRIVETLAGELVRRLEGEKNAGMLGCWNDKDRDQWSEGRVWEFKVSENVGYY